MMMGIVNCIRCRGLASECAMESPPRTVPLPTPPGPAGPATEEAVATPMGWTYLIDLKYNISNAFGVSQLKAILHDAGLGTGGNKPDLLRRILEAPLPGAGTSAGGVPTESQLGYIGGAARRKNLVPHITVLRSKARASQWLDEHGDYNRSRASSSGQH